MKNCLKIAVTGLNGTIGSKFSADLPDAINLSHDRLDLTEIQKIPFILDRIKPDVVIHLAAVTHIDHCEKDRSHGKNGQVWQINVEATKAIAEYVRDSDSFLLFLSTECVFDGRKEYYREKDKKKPINWYGITKSHAEDIIINLCQRYAILRSVIAYHENDQGKTLLGKIIHQLKLNKKFYAVNNQLITPTYTNDIIKAIKILLEKKLTGIFHLCPKKNITPFKFALKTADHFKYDGKLVIGKSLVDYFGSKRASLRLKNACLDPTASLKILDMDPLSIDQVLLKIKK